MTGYTVHTGSTEKFSDGWDRIFGSKPKAGSKSSKKTANKKTTKKPETAKQSATAKKRPAGDR